MWYPGYLSNSCVQMLRTFLHLQLHHVDEPVGAAGLASQRMGKKKEERKKEMRIRMTKMTRKQKKVSIIYSCQIWKYAFNHGSLGIAVARFVLPSVCMFLSVSISPCVLVCVWVW